MNNDVFMCDPLYVGCSGEQQAAQQPPERTGVDLCISCADKDVFH